MAKVSPTLKNEYANTNVGINTLGYYNSVNSQKETAPEYKCGTDFRNYSNSDADLYTLSNYARSYKQPPMVSSSSSPNNYYSAMGKRKRRRRQ
jgi:hypothetical protein